MPAGRLPACSRGADLRERDQPRDLRQVIAILAGAVRRQLLHGDPAVLAVDAQAPPAGIVKPDQQLHVVRVERGEARECLVGSRHDDRVHRPTIPQGNPTPVAYHASAT